MPVPLIRPTESSEPRPEPLRGAPRVGFLALGIEGPAPARDALTSIRAEVAIEDGTWIEDSLEPDVRSAAEVIERYGNDRVWILPERMACAGWAHALGLERGRWFALDELSAWVDPGGLGADPEALAAAGRAGAKRALDLTPGELRRALSTAVGHLLALSEMALGAVARAWELAAVGLDTADPEAAARLRTLALIANAPSSLGGPARLDGRLYDGGENVPGLDLAMGSAPLGFERVDARQAMDWPEHPLPVHTDGTRPLSEDDAALVHQIFAAPRVDDAGAVLEPRPAQGQVAEAVTRTLGSGELCLLHAPTGTGKTLAYLVPALLFALRNGVRVGVATYTRALQRQAHGRDVPIALELLENAGIVEPARVSMLKGRQNYVCGRSLAAQVPAPADGAATAVGFAHLATFALTSPDGDLDQLPPLARTPFGGVEDAPAELARLVRAARGRTGCCKRRNDRDRCGADVARGRAERSHVVLTNHAFALARREFCAHIVFDECEHLHDQAHSAFSHVVSSTELEEQLRALRSGTQRRRRRRSGRRAGPLDRLIKVARMDSAAFRYGQTACDQQEAAIDALAGLETAAERFLTWRQEQSTERAERDSHSLLREYVEARVDPELPLLHVGLNTALARLDAALAAVTEELDSLPEGGRRLRQSIERARIELLELSTGIDAWLPLVDGVPDYRPETFYDLERGPRGKGVAFHARVLLPNEFLGRYLFPDLRSAVLMSATTYLGGGFDASSAYLGIDRAAEPAPDEDREPSTVRTERAPESFDYGRVLVACPTDAPDYRAGKAAWLDYTARYALHLATRTRGRALVLMTNAADALELHRLLAVPLAGVGVDCLTQGADSRSTEQLAAAFRSTSAAVLIGLDTFWFGADFPGQALEHVIVPKLPYGVPDRYHHAQCAVLGTGAQRKRIYMPRSLARFRQGFGRLMRRATDRGCVHLLDTRAHEPRHKAFLRELPIEDADEIGGAHLLRASTDRVLRAAFEHLSLEAWDLEAPFADTRL